MFFGILPTFGSIFELFNLFKPIIPFLSKLNCCEFNTLDPFTRPYFDHFIIIFSLYATTELNCCGNTRMRMVVKRKPWRLECHPKAKLISFTTTQNELTWLIDSFENRKDRAAFLFNYDGRLGKEVYHITPPDCNDVFWMRFNYVFKVLVFHLL